MNALLQFALTVLLAAIARYAARSTRVAALVSCGCYLDMALVTARGDRTTMAGISSGRTTFVSCSASCNGLLRLPL